MTSPENKEWALENAINKIADTTYEPFDTTIPGARHTYGQIPGLNSTLRRAISSLLEEQRESLIKDKEDEIMGTIVKNSTGFDTYGNGVRLWHLDIDAFNKDLKAIIKNN